MRPCLHLPILYFDVPESYRTEVEVLILYRTLFELSISRVACEEIAKAKDVAQFVENGMHSIINPGKPMKTSALAVIFTIPRTRIPNQVVPTKMEVTRKHLLGLRPMSC